MRTIPAATRDQIEQEAAPDAILAFLTVRHDNLVDPIRVVSDVLDYVWSGSRFTGIPFGILAVTDDDSPPYAEIRMQNIDRRIGRALRDAPRGARVEIAALSSADFDLSQVPRVEIGTPAVIYAFHHFELVDVTVTTLDVTGRLVLRDPTQEPWPSTAATKSRAPGIFR